MVKGARIVRARRRRGEVAVFFISYEDRLVGSDTGKGYVMPIFDKEANAEEFVVASGIEGCEVHPILSPEMLHMLCEDCAPKPGVRWIAFSPPPATDIAFDDERVVPVRECLEAFGKVYADDMEKRRRAGQRNYLDR